MSELLDKHFHFNATALSLRAECQKILASNIANADTPGYKARDIDFGNVLQQAMRTTSSTLSTSANGLTTAHPSHIALQRSAGSVLTQPLLYRVPHQDSIDGNSVDLDAERARFADNALRYEAALSEVNGKIKSLMSVLQGQ